jgi:hypothetical protein
LEHSKNNSNSNNDYINDNNIHFSMEMMPSLDVATSLTLPLDESEEFPFVMHSAEESRVPVVAMPGQDRRKQPCVSNDDDDESSSVSSSCCSYVSLIRQGEVNEDDDDEDYEEESTVRPSRNDTKRKLTMTHAQKQQHPRPNTKQGRRQKRRRKAYEPQVKVYVQHQDEDVLCQRGGLANSHPGNIWYRQAKQALQPKYFAASKSCKTDVSQELVNQVHARGGRFLTKDTSRANTAAAASCWYEVHNHVARTKAGQALREVYTPEKGAAKRGKYPKKRSEDELEESIYTIISFT